MLVPDSGRGYLSKIYNEHWMADFGFLGSTGQTVGDVLGRKGSDLPELVHMHPEETVRSAISTLKEFGVNVTCGMSSTLVRLADMLIQHGETADSVELLLFAGEPLFDDVRSVLAQAFPKATVGSLGYASDAASGGAEALALFDQNRYDIVLTDLLMPGMSGWEVLAAVRQRNPRMPVVIITGTAPTVDDPRAAQAGVAVLRKPVDVKALDDTIKEKLARRLAV